MQPRAQLCGLTPNREVRPDFQLTSSQLRLSSDDCLVPTIVRCHMGKTWDMLLVRYQDPFIWIPTYKSANSHSHAIPQMHYRHAQIVHRVDEIHIGQTRRVRSFTHVLSRKRNAVSWRTYRAPVLAIGILLVIAAARGDASKSKGQKDTAMQAAGEGLPGTSEREGASCGGFFLMVDFYHQSLQGPVALLRNPSAVPDDTTTTNDSAQQVPVEQSAAIRPRLLYLQAVQSGKPSMPDVPAPSRSLLSTSTSFMQDEARRPSSARSLLAGQAYAYCVDSCDTSCYENNSCPLDGNGGCNGGCACAAGCDGSCETFDYTYKACYQCPAGTYFSRTAANRSRAAAIMYI